MHVHVAWFIEWREEISAHVTPAGDSSAADRFLYGWLFELTVRVLFRSNQLGHVHLKRWLGDVDGRWQTVDTGPCMAGNAAGDFRCAVTADDNRLGGADTSTCSMVY